MTAKKWLLFSVPVLLAVALLVAAAVPSWRETLQNKFSREGHEVLATADGDVLNDGSLTKVVKYRGSEGIYVEVLKMDGSAGGTLVDRILLPDKRDGLFNYQGHVTRLAIGSIDGSGQQVLLAPTFDNQLVPHLNVFRYNREIRRFELYTPAK